MSANLLDGIKPKIAYPERITESDGVITFTAMPDGWYDIAVWTLDEPTLTENQTIHLGISMKWHDAAATAGDAYMSVKYADAAGHINNINILIDGITTEWRRFQTSAVMPSGMHIVDFHFSAKNLDAGYDATNPTLSYGTEPLVLALASTTLAWSAGIVATTRYYQLAAPTAATPAVPASSSSLGSWSETEPTADVTKVLWTCERTVYADGTESWSKASKSTSYEAAKDAKDAAKAAQSTADGVAKSRALLATCQTAQGVLAKEATLAAGALRLVAGASVSVQMANANVASGNGTSALTLDVAGTGAKPIMTCGSNSAF